MADEEKEQLKKQVKEFNDLYNQKVEFSQKLKNVNLELKEKQTTLTDWLIENEKGGFAVDNKTAEIKLKKRIPKLPINKKHIGERLKKLFENWKLDDIDQKVDESVICIWSDLVRTDKPITYWLEKKQNKRKINKNEAYNLNQEDHIDKKAREIHN